MALTDRQMVQFIERELGKVPGEQNRTRRFINIVCCFHRDSKPSLGIRIAECRGKQRLGDFYCFGCKKAGPWNDLAKKLRLTPIKEGKELVEDEVHFVRERYSDLLSTKSGVKIDELLQDCNISAAIPWNPQQAWRGFKGKFLAKFGTLSAIKNSYDKRTGRRFTTNMLFFPVNVNGELVGGITARFKKSKMKGVPSYVNSPGEWSRTLGLFPYDYVERMIERKGLDYVVLVEGPRDALFLISKGIPALCILGTSSFTERKARLVAQLPIERVWILGDGDKAGHQMNRALKKILKPLITTGAIKIPITKERYDPCSLPEDMKRRLFKKLSSPVASSLHA